MSFERTAAANPTAGDVIRSRDDLVDLLRARKAELGLSNSFVDHALLMASGGTDKILGPTQAKGLTLMVALDMVELFGCKLMLVPCPEREAKMQTRWERREEGQVRRQKRVSKAILARAAPLLFAALGRAGGIKRAKSLAAKQRREIARTAALSRWRLHRAAAKARAIAETAA